MKTFLTICSCIITILTNAQTPVIPAIPSIPSRMIWKNTPLSSGWEKGTLVIKAGPATDLFSDPQDAYRFYNAPMILFSPGDSFQLKASVKVGFHTDFDAGALVLYAGNDYWAKLAFELSPAKEPTIVSVVNNRISDDCNHQPVPGSNVFLRISGLGHQRYAFHYSTDGKRWNLVRYFYLSTDLPVQIGFSSQSPTGTACESAFSEIGYSAVRLRDIRNGD